MTHFWGISEWYFWIVFHKSLRDINGLNKTVLLVSFICSNILWWNQIYLMILPFSLYETIFYLLTLSQNWRTKMIFFVLFCFSKKEELFFATKHFSLLYFFSFLFSYKLAHEKILFQFVCTLRDVSSKTDFALSRVRSVRWKTSSINCERVENRNKKKLK